MSPEPIAAWHGWSAGALASQWNLPAVHLFRRVGSTNDVARQLGEAGAPSGTAVVAEEQVTGRGRAGRLWASPPGLGVWLSVIVRPAELPNPAILPLAIGLAVAKALDPFASPGTVMLKWPNDLVINGRKLGGILCDAAWSGGTPAFVVVGIGINVQHSELDFSADLRLSATSLRRVTDSEHDLPDVAGVLAQSIFAVGCNPPAILDGRQRAAFEVRDALWGRPIAVDGAPFGTAAGVAPDGALLVRTANGEIRAVRSGTVRPAQPTAYA